MSGEECAVFAYVLLSSVRNVPLPAQIYSFELEKVAGLKREKLAFFLIAFKL
jgi:hypothetical protein